MSDNDYAFALAEIERLQTEIDHLRFERGCARDQRTTQWCAEVVAIRRAWLRVIQGENGCTPSGGGCSATKCGCVAEQEMLILHDLEGDPQ